MDDGPEQGGQDDYEPDVARERVFPRLLPKRLARNVEASNELSRRLGQGRSARRISAPAPGSGDRRAGQFVLAKGKLHGLLSGAEP
jgi:hypothetical protein